MRWRAQLTSQPLTVRPTLDTPNCEAAGGTKGFRGKDPLEHMGLHVNAGDERAAHPVKATSALACRAIHTPYKPPLSLPRHDTGHTQFTSCSTVNNREHAQTRVHTGRRTGEAVAERPLHLTFTPAVNASGSYTQRCSREPEKRTCCLKIASPGVHTRVPLTKPENRQKRRCLDRCKKATRTVRAVTLRWSRLTPLGDGSGAELSGGFADAV